GQIIELENRLKHWLEHAKWAASGGNAQPWKVECDFEGERLVLSLSIGEDYSSERVSPMDVDGIASVMALGGLAFNLEIMANHDGYAWTTTQFEIGTALWNGKVILTFEPQNNVTSSYKVEDVYLRRTNREAYKNDPLPELTCRKLVTLASERNNGIKFVDATSHRDELIKSSIGLERVRWQSSHLLDSLLDEIDFTESSPFGIPADQLGVKAADQSMIKMMKSVPPMRFMFKVGGQYMVSQQSFAAPLKNAGGVFFLQAPNTEFSTCFDFGFAYQHIWTELNRQGIAFQPVSVTLVALGLLKKSHLTGSERSALSSSKKFFQEILAMNIEQPIMGFRAGYPTKGADKSPRRAIDFSRVDGMASLAKTSTHLGMGK
ncbi:MAG: hypothetical protein KDD59_13220, partial [Bdellovibrionales bacterium]|nr:hypothetical protein [Bdellovibrionales bacterium]